MGSKTTTTTKSTQRRKTTRKSATAKKSGRRDSWKKVFERYLVQEGYSPAEAKELVELSAA
jgi:hypothetical protein